MTKHPMKRLLASMLLLLVVTMAMAAKPWTVEAMPTLDNTTRVMNPDGVLATATVDSINAMLLTLDRHGVQPLVVCIQRIEGDDPYEFAIGLGRRFGVGGRKSLGVVMVVATEDRSYQIVTGSGMDKYLPDAICSRIEHVAMVPHLKAGAWDAALLSGVRMMKQYLDKDEELMAQLRAEEAAEDWEAMVVGLVFALIPVVIIALIAWQRYKDTKCPQCGKHRLRVVRRESYKDARRRSHLLETVICQNCGHTFKRDRILHDGTSAGVGGAIFLGGGRRGGGFGGGFGGGGFGSFGGGSFGGGGAGGRF